MQNMLINSNGKIISENEAVVSVLDRGFLYGDSLYEVLRTYGGKFFRSEDHLHRLFESARYSQMPLNQTAEQFQIEIERTWQAFLERYPDTAEGYCRLIVTRGKGRIGFGRDAVMTPTQYWIIVQSLNDFLPSEPKTRWEKGLNLTISSRIRNHPLALNPAMKSGNYLNSLLAYLDAADAGFDDALLCDMHGSVTEGTTFNVFYIRRGILATPPLDVGILDGITRRVVIDCAREMGIKVREVRFPKVRLYEADEIFVTSSIKEVYPVVRVDRHRIRNGKPGSLTRKLHLAFQEVVGSSLHV